MLRWKIEYIRRKQIYLGQILWVVIIAIDRGNVFFIPFIKGMSKVVKVEAEARNVIFHLVVRVVKVEGIIVREVYSFGDKEKNFIIGDITKWENRCCAENQ